MKALWIAQYAIAWIEDQNGFTGWPRLSRVDILRIMESVPEDRFPDDLLTAGVEFARWFVDSNTPRPYREMIAQAEERTSAPRPYWLPE